MNKQAAATPMTKMAALRRAQKLTQGDLAVKVGVRPMTIYYYEAGVRTPSSKTLKRLSTALQCTIDDLIE